MISKERLLEIHDLNLSNKIEQMSGENLENYFRQLNYFIENFPEYEENIKNTISNKDYDNLTKNLKAIYEILLKIYADKLAQDCLNMINDGFNSTTHEKTETIIICFLANLSMLSIDIQMAENDLNAQAAESASAVKTEPSTENKILAVDDTAFFLTMLKTALQDTRYKLICVTNGKDALKFLEKNSPNLFLLDIEMPDMDGYELAAKIRETGQKAPIVFLTGTSRRENVTRAMQAGAVDFVIKPLNKELLLTKIAKYIM